jgi:hypothetical protein
MNRVAAVLLALPLLLGTGRLVSMTMAESLGPVAEERVPLNIAEAAGMEDAGEVVRRLRLGEDPGRILPVRPHVISSSIPFATAFEAAIWSRSVELVALFDREGAPLDEQTRAGLACLAGDVKAEDIRSYLVKDHPVTCQQDAALKRIEARAPARPSP